jgi:anti-sigma factor (TIGR02949 family)
VSRRFPWWRRMVGSPSMASCMDVGRVLQSYLDGEVDEVAARRVARHLEACRRCGLEASTYAEIKQALTRRSRDVPQDAVDRLRRFGEDLVDTGDEPGHQPGTGRGAPG